MSRIFVYELKRLILNKFFFLFVLVTGLYGYMILRDDIIPGIAYTAPFSPWSYGMYLASILPLSLITMLFFITFLHSQQEKNVKQLTFATPVDLPAYCLVKGAAITAGYGIISLFGILVSLVFYAKIFGFFNFGDFIIPVLVTFVPGFLFVFGLGLLAGNVQPNILYILMIGVLVFRFFPVPPFFDLYGGHLFGGHPLTLPVGSDGEPAFSLPFSFIMGKIFFGVTGIVMAFFGMKRYGKVHTD